MTRLFEDPVRPRTNPREKHVLPAPKSPSRSMTSPAVESMESSPPMSSMSSGVGMDRLME